MKQLTLNSRILVAALFCCTLSTLHAPATLATGTTQCRGINTQSGVQSVDTNSGTTADIVCAAQRIEAFLSGDIARAIVLVAIIVCGGMYIMDRKGQNAQRLGGIALGACLIFLASPVFRILGIGGVGI